MSRLRTALGVFVALVLVAIAWPAQAAPAPAPRLEDPSTGRAETIEPGPAGLHVVFFATWCPDCVGELSRLAELEDVWRSRGYRLVLVAVQTRHERSRLADFVASRQPPGRLLFDAAGEAERAFAPKGLPAHLLIDANGKEVARTERLDAGLERAIRDLLDRAAR